MLTLRKASTLIAGAIMSSVVAIQTVSAFGETEWNLEDEVALYLYVTNPDTGNLVTTKLSYVVELPKMIIGYYDPISATLEEDRMTCKKYPKLCTTSTTRPQ